MAPEGPGSCRNDITQSGLQTFIDSPVYPLHHRKGNTLNQGLANYSPGTKPGPWPVFVNKALLARSDLPINVTTHIM